jgi:hypothetical protein
MHKRCFDTKSDLVICAVRDFIVFHDSSDAHKCGPTLPPDPDRFLAASQAITCRKATDKTVVRLAVGLFSSGTIALV